MNKENYFIDLSKLSEEQQNHIFSLLPKFQESFADIHFPFLQSTDTGIWYCDDVESVRFKTELLYPEFIKLFEEGETFSQRMEKELSNNAHKGDWQSFAVKKNRHEILREIEHHYNKLLIAYESGNEELIREYSADIGNIAMFMYESTNSK